MYDTVLILSIQSNAFYLKNAPKFRSNSRHFAEVVDNNAFKNLTRACKINMHGRTTIFGMQREPLVNIKNFVAIGYFLRKIQRQKIK